MSQAAPHRSSGAPRRTRRRLLAVLIASGALLAGAAALTYWLTRPVPLPPPPAPDPAGMDPAVALEVAAARDQVVKSPRSADAWGNLGMVFLGNQLNPEAAECFARAERLADKEARWPYLRAVAVQRTDPDAAVAELRRALELGGDEAGAARLRLAELLLAKGQFDEAGDEFRRALEADPDDARAHLGLARLECQRDEPDGQSTPPGACGRRPARAEGGRPPARGGPPAPRRRGRRRTGPACGRRPAGGRALARPARSGGRGTGDGPVGADHPRQRVAPGGPRAAGRGAPSRRPPGLSGLGPGVVPFGQGANTGERFGGRRGRPAAGDPARAGRRRIPIRSRDRAVPARSACRSRGLLSQGDTTQARLRAAYYNLGHCLKKQGDRAGARTAFRDAVRCQPRLAEAHANLGELLAEDGRADEALAELRQAVKWGPDDAHARRLLEELQKRLAAPDAGTPRS